MNGTGNESKPTVHWTRYAVGVLATLAGLLLVWYFRDIVGYIIVSAVLAIIGTPLAKLMKRVRVRGRSVPDWLAALVVLLLLWGVGVAMFAIFIPLVFDKLTALASVDFSTILASFAQPLHPLQPPPCLWECHVIQPTPPNTMTATMIVGRLKFAARNSIIMHLSFQQTKLTCLQ